MHFRAGLAVNAGAGLAVNAGAGLAVNAGVGLAVNAGAADDGPGPVVDAEGAIW